MSSWIVIAKGLPVFSSPLQLFFAALLAVLPPPFYGLLPGNPKYYRMTKQSISSEDDISFSKGLTTHTLTTNQLIPVPLGTKDFKIRASLLPNANFRNSCNFHETTWATRNRIYLPCLLKFLLSFRCKSSICLATSRSNAMECSHTDN